jgi:hypothetical protein
MASPRSSHETSIEDVRDILVLDEDGQLLDVVEFLREFEADFLHWDGPPASYTGSAPAGLVVATARHALAFDAGPLETTTLAASEGEEGPSRIAVVEASTRTLESRLQELGFDFLVRRPVHPLALRLLLQRVLDRGDEKRLTERVPIGRKVSYRVGVRRRSALLAELSLRGGRLLVPKAHPPNRPITITLPRETGPGAPLTLSGSVVRCEMDDSSDGLGFSLGVAFRALSPEDEQALTLVLETWSRGPRALTDEQAARLLDPRDGRGRSPRLRPTREHRRRTPRRRFRGRVAALERRGGTMRALVGQNLSTEGMLIEPHPDLALGDKLCLALCGAPGERIVLRAEVVRDDGKAGLALRFDAPPEEVRRQLEALLEGLPTLERLVEGEPGGIATVVCEIQTTG